MRAALLVGVVWAWLITAVGVTAAAPPIRIMPLGDSITKGYPLEGGYRTRLYNLLTNAGYNVDFVGTQVLQSNTPDLPDPQHEGWGGFHFSDLDAIIEETFSAVDDADVILLLIGTNDFQADPSGSNATTKFENLIRHIAALRPRARILVSNLLKRTDEPAANNGIETVFNPAVPTLVSNLASEGILATFVNLHDCFQTCCNSDTSLYLLDGLHPNTTGYDAMADAWFTAITSVVTPDGSLTEAPTIARVSGQADLKHVVVTFSKPIQDAAASVSNFSLSGGLSVLGAELDAATKRSVTLTTSQQALTTTYTVTVNGVRDRTSNQNLIAANSTATFVSKSVAEAANYTLVYSLNVPNRADFNSTGVPYSVDKHATIGSFTRIAYYVETQTKGGPLQYVWVSMDAFTTDASKIGIPTVQSGAFFQQSVANMNIRSSVVGTATGVPGNLEFWPGDYGTANDGSVAGANANTYDFGDGAAPGEAGYGSMQVHRTGSSQTLFAFNGWGGAGLINDLGIGNSGGTHPDWTFSESADGYTNKIVQVYVLEGGSAPSTPVVTKQPSNLSASLGAAASFSVEASGTGPFTYQWQYNGVTIPGATASSYTINNVQLSHAGSYNVLVSNGSGTTPSSAAVLTIVENGVLSNGSFESGYSGWMATGNQSVWIGGPATDGNNSVNFNGGDDLPNGILSQSFATTVGQSYVLTFDLGVVGFTFDHQEAEIALEGNRPLLPQTVVTLTGDGSGTTHWFPQSFPFVADSATTTVLFKDVSPETIAIDLLLDNVVVAAQSPILRTVTINSLNSAADLPVTVSPTDSGGNGSGTTSFNRIYANGSVVNLTAPSTSGGNNFQKWLTNGVDYTTSASTSLTINGNYTVTAVYSSSTTRTLTVNSSNPSSGVSVTLTPNDNGGQGGATTSFSRTYNDGIVVNLTAPATAFGNNFLKWQTNGVDYTTSASTTLTMNANYTVTAVYVTPRTLTVQSSNPGTGVSVTLTPNDNNGQAGSTTSFSRTYNNGAVVTLTAPATASGNNFQKWQTNGVDYATTASTTLTLDANYTVTAVYVTPRTLTVQSSNPASGVSVTLTPNDNNGQAGSTTSFSRTYNNGAVVTLTAPATASGNNFQKWQTNGVDYATTRTVNLTLDANYTVKAVYVTPRTLTVQSSNPNSGVSVTLTPNDNNGQGGTTTSFTRTYNNGAVVTLTAPATASGNNFQKWQTNGVDYATTASTTLTLDANYTVTAVYVTPRTLTVQSSNPASGVSVTLTPNDNNGQAGSTTSFSRTYNNGAVVTLTAPATASGNNFQKWQTNGVDYATTRTVNLTLDANYTVTAVYVTPRTLTVQSSNPNSGVSVTLTPNDNNGQAGSTTSFSRTYNNGAVVTLTAPATASGNNFQKWQTNGVDYATTRTVNLTLDANYTVKAVYVTPRTLTVQSSNPDTGVSVALTPNDNNGDGGATTSFTRTYNSGTIVSLTAPSSISGNTFLKWQTNGVDYTTSASTSLTLDANYTATAVYASTVVGAYVFYNNSAWDGNNPAANANDDNAIATDKEPLLPGAKASFLNYTSYDKGINGVMLDFTKLPGVPTASDFEFRTGNDNSPNSWPAAAAPTSIGLRVGAGNGGGDRLTLVWATGAVKKQWLGITVLANANTGLAAPFTFYFGNAVGDSGDFSSNAQVDVSDENAARIHPHSFLNPAAIDVPYDYDRDKRVDVSDENLSRINGTSFINALKLIDLSQGLLGGSTVRFAAGQIALLGASTSSEAGGNSERERGLSVSDRPFLTISRVPGGRFQLTVTAKNLSAVRVEAATDLELGEWRELAKPSGETISTSMVRWTLSSNAPQVFFRLVFPLAPE